MRNHVILENITSEMASEILAIRHDAIHNGQAREFYDLETLSEWSPAPNPQRAEAWARCWKESGAVGVLAKNRHGHPVGYGILNPIQARIGAVYVRNHSTNSHAGDQIIKYLERLALFRNLPSLALDSSLSDVNFYLRNWYMVIGIDFFELPSGKKMPCAKMSKMINNYRKPAASPFQS